jgi:hypothetical protein
MTAGLSFALIENYFKSGPKNTLLRVFGNSNESVFGASAGNQAQRKNAWVAKAARKVVKYEHYTSVRAQFNPILEAR